MWDDIARYIPHALYAFFATFFLTIAALRLFPKFGLLDRPQRYGLARTPIPYTGGLIIAFAVLSGLLVFLKLDRALIAVLIGSLIIAVVSFVDDRRGLSPIFRLVMQILVGAVVVFGGVGIRSITNPFGDPFVLDSVAWYAFGIEIWPLSALFVMLWLVGMMNVMNWLDGLNGLASGIGVIGALTMFGLSIQRFHTVDQHTVSVMSVLLAFAALAFLLFEFYPAKILMGDTGSMFLGFFLGVLAIFAGGKVATALLIMGFPVLDAAWVIIRRLLQRRSPFRGDFGHLHHRLLHAGMSHRGALLFNYTLAALFGGSALLLESAQQKMIIFLIVFLLMIFFGFLVWQREKKSF